MLNLAATSIIVTSQDDALRFYTETLGLEVRQHIPMGDVSYLSVGAADQPTVEISLEPAANDLAITIQRGLYGAGIPAMVFGSDDLDADYERLVAAGVHFTQPPQQQGPVTLAVLDDTVGNYLMLMQRPRTP